MADVESAVGYSRMGPVFAGTLSNPERADYFKILRRSLDQSHIAGIFIVAVQHTIGVDNRAFVSVPFSFIHNFSTIPIKADPIASGVAVPVSTIEIAVDQDDTAVVNISAV